MKKLIVLLSLVLGIGAVHAQNTVTHNPANRAYFGLRVAGDIMFPGKTVSAVKDLEIKSRVFNAGGGFELGGIYNLPLVANLYLEPGLKFFYDTYTFKKHILDIPSSTGRVHRFGFRIPVMAGYHFDLSRRLQLHLFTGPELEVGLWSRYYLSCDDGHESENLYGGGGYHRVDLSWNVGAGISYDHFWFGINGAFGMLNMLDMDDWVPSGYKMHENRLSIGIGYNF